MKTLEELSNQYIDDTAGMLKAMMKVVQTYGHNLNPNEYFSVIEDWIMSLNRYMLHVMLAASDEKIRDKAEKEFMDYAMFDKIARLYALIETKKGKNLIVP